MPTPAEQAFVTLLAQLQEDPDVLGAFLSGSRGKGFATDMSDYDVIVIAQDGALERCQARYPFRYTPDIDCVVHDLSGFRTYAAFGSPEDWDRYDFAHVELLFDHTGDLPALIREKGTIPPDYRDEVLRSSLDAYINSLYRSLKCWRNSNSLGARLEAAGSVSPLLRFLFALEAKHAPFPGYLEQELEHYPLVRLPLDSEVLLRLIDQVLATAEPVAQQELLGLVDDLARDAGLTEVLDGWDDDYAWMRTVELMPPHHK